MQYTKEKPYKSTTDVTYQMITEHPYFKEITTKELTNIIGHMNYEGFLKLEGEDSLHKADNLINKWKLETPKECNNYAIY